MLSQVQRKGNPKVSVQVQSVGFPRAWSDERIRDWLKGHHITPLKRPHRTMGRFAWTRILEPDRARYRYRTGSWGKGIKVRYAIPKGGRRNLELLTVKPGKILPVSNPAFNIREATKQMILLEEHLSVPAKRCPDCIGKHLLAIEALADEAACLDKEQELGRLPGELGTLSRKAQGDLLSGADPCKVAQDIRAVRKKLLKRVFPYKKP